MTQPRRGLYSKCLFPRLCDWVLDRPLVARHRRELLAEVFGGILEIGVGTGLNLPCYPAAVRKITVVEPNPGMNKRLQRRSEMSGIEVDQRIAGGESLPFPDQSFDFVVSSFTLCSIRGVAAALCEIHRVLKTGGQFVFLEHGRSPDAKVQKWQRRLNWVQAWCADGCRLDLDVSQLLAAAPFHSVDVHNYYLEHTPRTHGFIYQGSARRQAT